LSDETIRDEGFRIFKNGLVRRLSPTHYVVRTENIGAWRLLELKDGAWACDCGSKEPCSHLYAIQLHRSTAKLKPDFDATHLKCRYCGSPDIAKCGFRYNSRGMARRYFCHDCQRKFSVPYIEKEATSVAPSETLWLLGQVAMLTSKLNDLIRELDERIMSRTEQVTVSSSAQGR